VWFVGTSKKKAKHSAAETLLSLVEGVDLKSTVDDSASYVVVHLFLSVKLLYLCGTYVSKDISISD